jgi:hypothetical protein
VVFFALVVVVGEVECIENADGGIEEREGWGHTHNAREWGERTEGTLSEYEHDPNKHAVG